jgi:hypothetical protein
MHFTVASGRFMVKAKIEIRTPADFTKLYMAYMFILHFLGTIWLYLKSKQYISTKGDDFT